MSEIQYFTRPGGFNSNAAYCRFDTMNLQQIGVVVTIHGEERQPVSPIMLGDMISLVRDGQAVKITAEEAALLVTDPRESKEHNLGWR